MLRDDFARVSMVLGDYVKAREALEEAIRMKPDYAAAHFRLAQIAIIKGNVEDAILNTERAALSAPDDIGILFQLGMLYYQQNRYREARQILERAVHINTNYSNARYFLGLIYASEGERTRAVEQFELIQALNPDNREIKTILANLQNGREPLAGITPPPLTRNSPPVVKEGKELEQEGELKEGNGSE
ncbi:MAG: tetratricopeptide repeat protein, partial [Patescibacteria group bacterium]